MSRVESHGGGTWAFPNCIWSPTDKEGGGKWPFWSKVLTVREDDTVLHLRGIQPKAYFVGYSRASCNGFITTERPPDAGSWAFSNSFYRADLTDYTPFYDPISLSAIFSERRRQLESYFDNNKATKRKRNIFYVRQAGRIQCLNGAYLSEVSEELFQALFGDVFVGADHDQQHMPITLPTGTQIRSIYARIGQEKFSLNIKQLYDNKCCFPSCEIDDARFLVAAHIARWSDNERLRGHLGNGLCFCLFHDKAFELGLFTLDENLSIYINPKEVEAATKVTINLAPFAGHPIKKANIVPLQDALLEHWIRVGVCP